MNLNPFKRKSAAPIVFLNRAGRRSMIAMQRKQQGKRGPNFTKPKKRRK